MLLSSLNTGSTDLRDTEVQQPNTAATLSLVMSSRAFSANSGQLEAGSTTTASSFLPSRPPFLFCSSISMSMTSFSVVSLIAMVPESECRMPTLIVSWALAGKCRRKAERQARRGGKPAAGERSLGDRANGCEHRDVLLLTRANGPAPVGRTPAAARGRGNRKPRAKPTAAASHCSSRRDPAARLGVGSRSQADRGCSQNQPRCLKFSQPQPPSLSAPGHCGQRY